MTTPTQKGKYGDPTKDPGRSSGPGTIEVLVEVRLAGTRTQIAADYAAIVAASYTSGSVSIEHH